MTRTLALAFAAIVLLVLLAISGWHPYHRATWLMEVFPIFIALPVLALTRRRFPLTTLLYSLIFLHAVVLMVGGAYSYARVPLGFEVQQWLGLSRNPYDKLGHFMQGFVPALLAREVFIRQAAVRGRVMTAFLCICVVMTVSACYELVEWAAALSLGQGADEFLGTQGDPWDTQSDMYMALVGACAALAACAGLHDRQLASLQKP